MDARLTLCGNKCDVKLMAVLFSFFLCVQKNLKEKKRTKGPGGQEGLLLTVSVRGDFLGLGKRPSVRLGGENRLPRAGSILTGPPTGPPTWCCGGRRGSSFQMSGRWGACPRREPHLGCSVGWEPTVWGGS